MTRTHRAAALTLAAGTAAAALVLTGCSSPGGEQGGSQSLNIAYWNYGQAATDNTQHLIDGFTADHPDVTFTMTPIAGDNWGTYYANLATTIAGGTQPDLVFTASEGVKFLSQNQLIVPVNDYLAKPENADLADDIAPALLDSFSFDGEITAVPESWNDMVIYYNKQMFDAAGVDYPAADWTWDDFKATAAALSKDTDGDGTNDQYGYAWASNELFPGVWPWVANADGNMVSDDVCSATADSAPVEEAYTYLDDLLKDGSAAAPMPMSDIFAAFQNGTVAMFGGGRWPTATIAGNGFTDYDIQLYPTGKTYKTVVGAAGYAIMAGSANPDLGWEFQKYTLSPDVQDAKIGTAEKPLDSIPSLRSTAQKMVDAGIPPANGALFYDSVDKYDAFTPFPAPAAFSEYQSSVLRFTQLIFGGDLSVADGLSQMQSDLETIVSCD